jgi:hypothetical protein
VRFSVYRGTLSECGLRYDPELTYQGQFDVRSGEWVVKHWFADTSRKIDAIVASNDSMAFGAINTLRLRAMGIRVPEDVAVTGFDDTSEAAAFSPPLTTARQPFDEACSRAIDILCDMIEGEKAPGSVIVPSRMIIRQSCGCLSGLVQEAGETEPLDIRSDEREVKQGKAFLREELVKELMTAVPGTGQELMSSFLTNFIDDVENRQPGRFMSGVISIVHEHTGGNQDIMSMHRLLFILQKWVHSLWSDAGTAARAHNRILQAGVLIGESALHAFENRRIHGEKKFYELCAIGQELATTF